MDAQQKSTDAQAQKLQFLGLVSHELKTPLHAILGFSEMISKETLGPVGSADYKEFADEIRQSGEALLRRIDELITASRAWDGEIDLNEALFDVAKAVAAEAARHEGSAAAKGVILQNLVDGAAGALYGDVKAFGRALGALIENAVGFSTADGLVTLEAEGDEDGGLTIFVTDSGPGVAEDKRDLVFDLLSQGDGTLARAHEGMGLGLYLASTIMRRHGGEVTLENAPGEGARFGLRFPASRGVDAGDEDDLTVMEEGDAEVESGPALLELTCGDVRHRVFRNGADFIIGRRSGSGLEIDLALDDRRVSRSHGRIVFIDGAFFYIDESSRGSWVEMPGGPVQRLHTDVSPPLEGEGRIVLGDEPGAPDAPTIHFRSVLG